MKRVLALVAPALAAVAVVPGPASAFTLAPYCSSGYTLTMTYMSPASKDYDANHDGYICTAPKSNGGYWLKDNSYYIVW